ncbi:MAG: hypothetical protein K9K67_13565 [Bacteriovoracaceae bacterium]|nr:hypothetical protein [Bacteriovoracaceae bacterium]
MNAFIALFFVSCSSDVEDKSQLASTASFDVTVVTASKIDNIGFSGESLWSEIPQHKSINFRTCLNDITLQVPLQNQTIRIETPMGAFDKETNSQGCLSWDQDFDFHYFSQESLVDYPVRIKGVNGHQGNYLIPLKVNPWASNLTNAIFDERFDELPLENKLQITESKKEAFLFKNINLSYFNSGYDKDSATAFYDFRLNANLEARRLSLQGNPLSLKLEKGHFQVKLALIEERAGVYQKLSESEKEVIPQAGQIQENIKFYIGRGYQHHPDSRFYMHISLIPIGIPSTVGAHAGNKHEGILPLANLQGSAEGTLESIDNYSSELVTSPLKSEVILAAGDNKEDNVPGEDQDESFGIMVSKINVSTGVLLADNLQTTTARSRRMPVEICLVDTLSGQSNRPLPQTKVSLKGHQNQVTDTEEKREAITNTNGCFQSFIYLTYDYLSCERFYQIDYDVEILEGRYEGLKTSGKVAINPFNNNDLFYDLNQTIQPPQIDCEAPKLAISKFYYKNDGLLRSGFKLNQNLNLTIQKRYNIQFEPKFYRGSTYQEIENHKNLYQGEFNIKVVVLSPKHSEANYYSFNELEWDYVTSAQTDLAINANGLVAGDINLPFHLSETLFLSFKNLLWIEITPKNGLNLSKTKIMVPFFALAQGANLNTSLNAGELSDELKLKVEKDLQFNFKVPGHHEQLFRYEKGMEEGPIDRYRQELLRIGKTLNESFKVQSGDHETFNQLPPLGEENWNGLEESLVEKYKSQISQNDFRTLATNIGETPRGYLNRFCRLFYSLPELNKRKTMLLGTREDELGGQSFKDCMENPSNHIELVPMSFVEELQGRKEKVNVDGNDFTYISPRFKSDEEGKIHRGNAYFAAYGDRSSINWGERESESTENALSYGLEGPSMLFVGTSERHSRVEETYKVKNTAEMRAAFNRNYTSRDVIDLTYNSLTLEFTVKKKDCITLRSKKNMPRAYNFCRKESRMKRVEETWFFIGDTNMESHGIISDGNLKGDSNRNQVIRGQQNFNILWDEYETKDTLLVVRELGTISVGDAFDKYINKEKGLIPFENRYDHSFPGMMLPYSHKPTNSCTDCQDP